MSNVFSAFIEMIMWFISFLLLMWCITLIALRILNDPGLLGKKSHLIVVYDPSYILLNSIC